ncbi:MAG: hypothetical protein F4Y26_00540 [Gammaproteobacteria bacterium]|nr:hypothetical protein [Gammaproteobacteria bacterium]
MTNQLDPQAVDLVRELAKRNHNLILSHDTVTHILTHGRYPNTPNGHTVTAAKAVRIIREIAGRIEPPDVVVSGGPE